MGTGDRLTIRKRKIHRRGRGFPAVFWCFLLISCLFLLTACSGGAGETESPEETDVQTEAGTVPEPETEEETEPEPEPTFKEFLDDFSEPWDAWVIAFDTLNVRRFCYSKGTVIGSFSVGQKITVTGPAKYGFYPVIGTDRESGEEITGYCSEDYLSFVEYTGNAVHLDVVSWEQTDDRWRELTLGTTPYTLVKSGCTTTCLAMTESYLTGTTITPEDMIGMLTYSVAGDLYWPDDYEQDYGSDYLLKIYQKLQQGIPVLIGSSRKDGSQHWVVVVGYDPGDRVITSSAQLKKADFLINDPAAARYTLADFFADLPYFIKIAYYAG